MLCKNPFSSGAVVFGCGQCLPCRISRRRVWTHRIMLEALEHRDSCFVTLTYDDENCPGQLVPGDLQKFLKRFRKRMEPQKLRFFGVGEYGDATFRPHYHLAVFGAPSCLYGVTRHRDGVCCSACNAVSLSWGMGRVELGIVERRSAQYLAGYVVKKMTFRDDPRLQGREPEFTRMSLRPGIGRFFVSEIASSMLQHEVEEVDVPASLRHGSKLLPLGRYLRRALRLEVGRDVKAPFDVERAAEMLGLLESSVSNGSSVKAEVLAKWQGKIASLEARDRIFRKRGSI